MFSRRSAFVALLVAIIGYSGVYFVASYVFFTNDQIVANYFLEIIMFSMVIPLVADARWSKSPTERFGFFGITQNRHVFWFQLNTLFLVLSTLDAFIILVAITATGIRGFGLVQSGQVGFDLPTVLTVFGGSYLMSFILRNAVMNLLGQGYGRFNPGGKGKIAGTSVIGVAAFADVADLLLQENNLLGIARLQDAFKMLKEILDTRRIQLRSLDEAATVIEFTASFNMKVPFADLKKLAGKFINLSGNLESPSAFASLGEAIVEFEKQTKWPEQLQVFAPRSDSIYNTIGIVATVLSVMTAVASIVLNFFVTPGSFQLGPLSSSIAGIVISLITVAAFGFLAYRPYSRLSNSHLSLSEWNAFLDARGMPSKNPTRAFVISLLGGVLVIVSGFLVTLYGLALNVAIGEIGFVSGPIGILSGILIVAGSLKFRRNPAKHKFWGAIVVASSFLGLATALGGFLFGFVLGLIGGYLFITWRNPKSSN